MKRCLIAKSKRRLVVLLDNLGGRAMIQNILSCHHSAFDCALPPTSPSDTLLRVPDAERPALDRHSQSAPHMVISFVHAEVLIMEIEAGGSAIEKGAAIVPEDAFLLDLHLRDHASYRFLNDNRPALATDIRQGEVVLWDLRINPKMSIDGGFHVVRFHIPRAVLNEIAREAGGRRVVGLQCRPGVGLQDMRVTNLALMLRAELFGPVQPGTVFAGHVIRALLTHIAEAYGQTDGLPAASKGGLAPWQLKRAQDFLSANLRGAVELKDVARECGLSVSHFSRAFRQSIGTAPHSWLVKRRVAAATNMMQDAKRSLSDIALACGFADQSHFTRMFTREMGASPGVWRRCAARFGSGPEKPFADAGTVAAPVA
jgi:AraC family transcriptional regulator